MIGANPAKGCVPTGFYCGVIEAARISKAELYRDSFTPPEEFKKAKGTIGLYDFRYELEGHAPDRPVKHAFVPDRSGHGNHALMANTEYVLAPEAKP
jgi:hypothetical protein